MIIGIINKSSMMKWIHENLQVGTHSTVLARHPLHAIEMESLAQDKHCVV
jgi:hypothetical protein